MFRSLLLLLLCMLVGKDFVLYKPYSTYRIFNFISSATVLVERLLFTRPRFVCGFRAVRIGAVKICAASKIWPLKTYIPMLYCGTRTFES
jgi:hypothetical protein